MREETVPETPPLEIGRTVSPLLTSVLAGSLALLEKALTTVEAERAAREARQTPPAG